MASLEKIVNTLKSMKKSTKRAVTSLPYKALPLGLVLAYTISMSGCSNPSNIADICQNNQNSNCQSQNLQNQNQNQNYSGYQDSDNKKSDARKKVPEWAYSSENLSKPRVLSQKEQMLRGSGSYKYVKKKNNTWQAVYSSKHGNKISKHTNLAIGKSHLSIGKSRGESRNEIKHKLRAHQGMITKRLVNRGIRTLDIYDSGYRTIMYKTIVPGSKSSGRNIKISGDAIVAKAVFPYTLEQLVDKSVINPAMYEAMPLGVHYARGKVKINVRAGISNMWDLKIGRVEGTGNKQLANFFRIKKAYFAKKLRHPTKTTLCEYREKEIMVATNDFKHACNSYADEMNKEALQHEKRRDNTGAARHRAVARFMKSIAGVVSPNVFLGYNIQELAPAGCNPVYRARYLDLLLREGKEVIEGMPAVYDTCTSYGPFQLTAEFAQPGINSAAKYIPKKHRPPRKLANYNTLQHHATGAALFAFHNWKKIAWQLATNGLLDEFNAHFRDYKSEATKGDAGDAGLIKRQLLVSGITAAMHYAPGTTQNAISKYLKAHSKFHKTKKTKKGLLKDNSINDMAVGIKACFSNRRTERYYTGASEAYHLLRVYDLLDNKYREQYGSS